MNAFKTLTLGLTLVSSAAFAANRSSPKMAHEKVKLSEYAADGMTDNLGKPSQIRALLKAFAPAYPTTRIPVGGGKEMAEVHDYVIDDARQSIAATFNAKGIETASVRLSDSAKNLVFTTADGREFNAEVGYNNRGGPTIVSVER